MQENKFKKYGLIIAVLLVVIGWWVKSEYFDKPTLITVVGEGKLSVKPEMVNFSLSIVNSAPTATAAIADNNRLIKNTQLVLKNSGVAEKDITTSYVRVVTPSQAAGQKDYQAVNAIDATLNNVGSFDSLYTQLYQGGVQSISNIVFTTANSQDLEKQAVASAIKDAQTRAKEVAKSIGKRVGRMISVTTTEAGTAGALSGKTTEGGFTGQGLATPNQIEIVRQASIVFELR